MSSVNILRNLSAAGVWILFFVLCAATGIGGNHTVEPWRENGDRATIVPQVQQCSREKGGGVCPLKNTCCLITHHPDGNNGNNDPNNNATATSGCIPSDLGAFAATCCPDQKTGCGVGYHCIYESVRDEGAVFICLANDEIKDPLVQKLPRYSLCHASPYSNFQHIWQFKSPAKFHSPTTSMLYYSSHEGGIDMLADAPQIAEQIRMVLIVIHGANRNADDYFCSAAAAIANQNRFRVEQVLLLVPRFVVPSDLPSLSTDKNDLSHILRWEDIPNGPWRYGANAIKPNRNVSSFDVLDAMVDQVVSILPRLELIAVAGHSSGGQFVQRWALVSPYHHYHNGHQTFGSGEDIHVSEQSSSWRGVPLRAVVANPSSFAYLIPERYNATLDAWILPHDAYGSTTCREYNTWEWGLEMSNSSTPEYVQRVLRDFSNTDYDTNTNNKNNTNNAHQALIERFAKRDVIYLAGSLDSCDTPSPPLMASNETLQVTSNSTTPDVKELSALAPISHQWCNSHGLEVTCMDNLQGTNRLERHSRYIDMLARIGVATHRNFNVIGVGHDHSLMFSSPLGLVALFYQQDNGDAVATD